LFDQGCLNIQDILHGFRTSGNYYSTCGFLVALEHMISKFPRCFYNQVFYKAHFVSKFEWIFFAKEAILDKP